MKILNPQMKLQIAYVTLFRPTIFLVSQLIIFIHGYMTQYTIHHVPTPYINATTPTNETVVIEDILSGKVIEMITINIVTISMPGINPSAYFIATSKAVNTADKAMSLTFIIQKTYLLS